MFHFVILSKLETTSGEKNCYVYDFDYGQNGSHIFTCENTQNWKFQGMQIV